MVNFDYITNVLTNIKKQYVKNDVKNGIFDSRNNHCLFIIRFPFKKSPPLTKKFVNNGQHVVLTLYSVHVFLSLYH